MANRFAILGGSDDESEPVVQAPSASKSAAAGPVPAADKRGGGAKRAERGRGGGRGGRDGAGKSERRGGDHRSRDKFGSNPRPEKRGGAGGHNWGTAKDELAATTEEGAPPADGADESEPVPDDSMTLEEYMAAAAGKGKKSLPEARKAGEGEKTAKWKESQKLARGEEQAFFVGEAKKEQTAARKNQRALKKQTVDINVRFTPSSSDGPSERGAFRGGRGGRGGARGGRGGARGGRGGGGDRGDRGGRGGSRGGRGGASRGRGGAAPNVLSQDDFPKL